MPTTRVNTFKSGNSEAVRLPKGFGFGVGTRVRMVREGDRVVLTPEREDDAGARLRAMFAAMDAIDTKPLPRDVRDAPIAPERDRE